MVNINQLGLPQEVYPRTWFFVHRCSRCKVAWTRFGQLLAIYKAVKARASCKWNTSWTEGRLESVQNTHGLSTMLTFLCDTRHLLVRQRVPMRRTSFRTINFKGNLGFVFRRVFVFFSIREMQERDDQQAKNEHLNISKHLGSARTSETGIHPKGWNKKGWIKVFDEF